MQYVEVSVASQEYRGSAALTYATEHSLIRGTIVTVPLRDKTVLGVVVRQARRPRFKTKNILSIPNLPALPSPLLELLEWIPTYYPAPLGVVTQHFLPRKLPRDLDQQIVKQTAPPANLPPLTADQRASLAVIGTEGLHILHGDTGSGKTRVYVELTRRATQNGKSAIILTPEISLTPQLANDFRAVFGDAVVVFHSQLTESRRQSLWTHILRQQEPVIIVGPRSALFAPVRHLGLIILDEAHEPAYKQDQAPYYQTTRVASKLAALAHAPIILGSATPPIVDYYIAEQKKRPIIRMRQAAAATEEATALIEVADLRNRSLFTKSSFLSDTLLDSIASALSKRDQILLFLNRRGTARVVLCQQCGWQAICPHCDLPLVYHGDIHRMRCHTCEYKASAPTTCPSCSSAAMVYKSIGTKAVAEEIGRLFPEAKIQRFDADNKKPERIEQHYEDVRNGSVDIIIGTQLLAKGLDLPKLGLVGIVLADTSLYMPDFTAQERTYELLSQVIGRVGRGHRKGKVIVQTYSPDSRVLSAVLAKNWDSFYNTELAERRSFMFPPFCYLLKLSCRRATSESARRATQQFADKITTSGLSVSVDGPAPAFHEKVQGKYSWQLHIKAKDRTLLLKIIEMLPSGWSYDIDPLNLI